MTSNTGFGTRFAADQSIMRQNHAISETHVVNSRLLNEARVAYVRSNVGFPEHDPTTATTKITGFFTIGGLSNFPQGRLEQLYEFQDVATWISGRNSFKFGGMIKTSARASRINASCEFRILVAP